MYQSGIQPLLTVCIITYNHENFIRRCLEGVVMQQTNFPFAVVIGEDCSADGTRAVIEGFADQYPGFIQPIYQPSNVGANRNLFEFCLPRLAGRYVAICDGDDYWTDPYKLQKQVDFMEAHPECALCFHRADAVDGDDRLIASAGEGTVRYYGWQDIFHIHIPTLTVVYRNAIRAAFPEMLQRASGDSFLFGMLSTGGGAADLGFNGARYRVHPGGIFSSRSAVDQYRQAIYTRRLMRKCIYFNEGQRAELGKEISRRKRLYLKIFLRRGQIRNVVRILFS